MRRKKQAVLDKEQLVNDAIEAVTECQANLGSNRESLNKDITSKSMSIAELNGLLGKEKRWQQDIEDNKVQVTRQKGFLEQAQSEFETSKEDVSVALRKIEKYKLILEEVG